VAAILINNEVRLTLPAPRHTEFFPIEVTFEYIEARKERDWFKNLPAALELPRESVDKLRTVAGEILSEDPQFKRLMETLEGCIAPSGQDCWLALWVKRDFNI
jgi:NTE family protein